MATKVSYNTARLFITALARADQKLNIYDLGVGIIAQEETNPDFFAQKTDFELVMCYHKKWLPIDVLYLGPKKKASVKTLSQDIYEKVIDHLLAMKDTTVFITPLGTKYNTAHLKTHTLGIDGQGYLRIDGLRIVRKEQQMYRPIKATQFRSHTRITPEELEEDVLNITERYDENRTTREKGNFCVTRKAQFIAVEQIVPRRQIEAKEYDDGQYIPLVRTWRSVELLIAGTSHFFN